MTVSTLDGGALKVLTAVLTLHKCSVVTTVIGNAGKTAPSQAELLLPCNSQVQVAAYY